jgi:predicted nucleotidyltransferase
MSDRVHQNPNLIYSVGTQVVALRNIAAEGGRILHPRGSVGVVVRSPADLNHSYRVRFLDGFEEPLRRDELTMLAQYKEGEIGDSQVTAQGSDLFARVIYRCVVGSRAFGLEGEDSDTDYRGIYLPRADLHWSLYGVPEQIDREETQEQYWELQRFLVLALKANPNVLECLYTPLVEKITPLGEELLQMRSSFLSRLVFQTYNGLLFVTISGAHLYGFPSPDSDFDLRGVHLLTLADVVGLNVRHETVEKSGIHDGLEIDLVTHDAKKFFGLMLTGIHLMRSGEVEANLVRLNETADLPYIPDLIARKVGGAEQSCLEQADLEFHEREYQRLTTVLKQAFEASHLPETARGAAAMNDLLVRIRLNK